MVRFLIARNIIQARGIAEEMQKGREPQGVFHEHVLVS